MTAIRSLAGMAGVLASMALGQMALAASYYIDSVNGLDTNSGSYSSPKRTVAGLTGTTPRVTLQPGDVVNLRGTGPYNNPSVATRNVVFEASYSGTSAGVVTVQSDPEGGVKAVFDPGYPEFMANPNNAWVPCSEPGAHPDEYISVNTYSWTGSPAAMGSFLQSNGQAGARLLTYTRVEDLRTNNESWALVPYDGNDSHGRPAWGNTTMMYRWAYRGPGVWVDPATNKIHFRASSTHWNQPGITDYASSPNPSVGTDPRNLSLSLSLYQHFALNIQADYLTFKNIVSQNGGGNYSTLCAGPNTSNYNEHVTFDSCSFYPCRNGVMTNITKFTRFINCEFDGRLPSYVCRSDVKDDFSFLDYDGVSKASDGLNRMTQVILLINSPTYDEDMEVSNCEFRNGHDGVTCTGKRSRFHHNLIENCNDEGIMMYGTYSVEDVRVYSNVLRKVLVAFSSSEGGDGSSTGARYLYRNVVDLRRPTLGQRSLPPDTLSTWRPGADFKYNVPVPEFYCYQNTFIVPRIESPLCSTVWSNIDPTHLKTRRYMNNIYMAILNDVPLHIIPHDASWPNLSNGNNWHRRITNAATPELQWYNAAPPATTTKSYNTLADWLVSVEQASYVAANGVGWETSSRTAYPQFNDVQDFAPTDGGTLVNADYRLKAGSPDRAAGVDLRATGWPDDPSIPANATPDIGAEPYGCAPLAVGVNGRCVFPDSSTPISEAGDYSLLSDNTDGVLNGFETVSFDASGSSDPDGAIAGYNWVYNGQTISTAWSFSKALPVGTHNVYLSVTDNSGKSATDMRQVTITDPNPYDNLMRNPGFESGASDWTLTRAGPVVSSPTHFGDGAMSLVGQSAYASCFQEVPIVPGASTKVSGWLKLDNLPSGPKAKIQLQFLDAAHTGIATYYPAPNTGGTIPWTYFPTTPTLYTAPTNAVYARISLLLDSAATGGYAYFDDLRVMVTDNKVVNGFFEQGANGWTFYGSSRPTLITDPANVRSAATAIQIVGGASTYGQALQKITGLTPGTLYNVSGWIKTNTVPTGSPARIFVTWRDAGGSAIGSSIVVGGTSGSITGTQPYTLVSSAMTAPAGTASADVIPKLEAGAAGGTAWFDDVYLR